MHRKMNIEWCDLGIVQLKIISSISWMKRRVKTRSVQFGNKESVNIFILSKEEFEKYSFSCNLYRENIMKKGVYIGHHCGKPAYLKILDKWNIYLYAPDPDAIIWCYIYKYVLTVFTIDTDYLHLKGGAMSYKDSAILVGGRGGSGKTKMIEMLCDQEISYMGNTHLIYNRTTAELMGIDSTVRVRTSTEEEVYIPAQTWKKSNVISCWKKLKGVFWVNYQDEQQLVIKRMNDEELFHCMHNFSDAINTWEMKEDIFDYLQSNPFHVATVFEKEKQKLLSLVKMVDKFYISADITNNQTKLAVKDIIFEICR